MLGTLLSTHVIAGGADVSVDEIFSDGVVLTTYDGLPLDIDGDGKTDLAIAANRGEAAEASRYYLGNGDSTFATPASLTAGASSRLVAADLNADMNVDLVQGRRDLTNLLYLNNGAGGVGADASISVDTAHTLGVAIGDLDNDGDLDIVTGNGRTNGSGAWQANRFYLNNIIPDGTLAFAGADIAADADNTRSIELADMDGDGDLDVVVGNDGTTASSNRIYLNQFIESGMLAITFGAGIDFGPADDLTVETLVGDLDNDGLPDIVALNAVQAGTSPGLNRFFINESNAGTFALGAGADVSTDRDRTNGGVLADFDGDGGWLILTDNGDGTATLSGTPTDTDVGEHEVTLEVSDGTSGALQMFTIAVSTAPADNSPPSFNGTPPMDATVGKAYEYEITATDDDAGDTLTITGPTVPVWATLVNDGDGTGVLSGTPTASDIGDHTVSLQVSDSTETAVQNFTITVAAATVQPPQVLPPLAISGGGSVGFLYLVALLICNAASRRCGSAPALSQAAGRTSRPIAMGTPVRHVER